MIIVSTITAALKKSARRSARLKRALFGEPTRNRLMKNLTEKTAGRRGQPVRARNGPVAGSGVVRPPTRQPDRDGAGNDRPARRPSWPRRPAPRECRRRDRDGLWS